MKHAAILILAASALSAAAPMGTSFQGTLVPLGARARRLLVAPLDEGSTPDVAVIARRKVDEVTLVTFRGVGDGSLEPADLLALPQFGYAGLTPTLAAADFDDDGLLDLGIAAVDIGQILLGDGDLEYDPVGGFPTLGGSQHGLGFTDIDGDGDLDSALLVDDLGGWFLDLGTNDGDGAFGGSDFVEAPGSPVGEGRLLFADTNNDGGDATFAVGGSGLATSGFPGGPGSNELLLPGSFGEVIAAHLNGDAFLDLAVAAPLENGVYVLLNDGAGGFPSASYHLTGRKPESLAAGDLTGDGITDLAVANRREGSVVVLAGDGLGGFDPTARLTVAAGPVDIEAVDLNGDGDLDLVVACDAGLALTVLHNQLER